MEKHKCKLCLRSFSNGRALGGHMRSHMLNLPIVQKPESPPPPPPLPLQPQSQHPPPNQLSGTVSASLSSSSSSEDDDDDADDDEKGIYGLRENPKRSFRLVDPEFSFAVDAGSVVLQDRESETESSKNPTRKRSKRTRSLDQSFHHQYHHQRIEEQAEAMKKQLKFKYKAVDADQSSWAEPEPVSSISDTTTEEHVAFCLMMLSRDKWKKQEQQQQPQDNNEDDDAADDDDDGDEEEEEDEEEQEQEQEEDEAVESDESEEPIKLSKTTTRTRGKFKCETCKKTFRSYQALGGHRASHKKIKLNSSTTTPANNYEPKLGHQNVGTPEKKVHECPVCFRVFSSGQALGGHKRTHVTGSTSTPTSARASTKLGQALIDLNLPAPMDDDDISQIEHSAVSDAEFVNPIRR